MVLWVCLHQLQQRAIHNSILQKSVHNVRLESCRSASERLHRLQGIQAMLSHCLCTSMKSTSIAGKSVAKMQAIWVLAQQKNGKPPVSFHLLHTSWNQSPLSLLSTHIPRIHEEVFLHLHNHSTKIDTEAACNYTIP